MNRYDRHIGDYIRDTAHLTMLEDGAYNRLLDLYYIREHGLPADVAAICRLVRAMNRPEREAVKKVLEEFFRLDGDAWRQKRADGEIEVYLERIEKARAAGKTGGRPRKVSQTEPFTGETGPLIPETPPFSTEKQNESSRASARLRPGALPPSTPHSPPPLEDSVPVGTAAVAAPNPAREYVFLHGVTLLTTTGTVEKTAREFLGKSCSAHGDAAVANAVAEAIRHDAGAPLPYIQKILSNNAPGAAPRKSRQDAEAEARRAHNAAVLGVAAP